MTTINRGKCFLCSIRLSYKFAVDGFGYWASIFCNDTSLVRRERRSFFGRTTSSASEHIFSDCCRTSVRWNFYIVKAVASKTKTQIIYYPFRCWASNFICLSIIHHVTQIHKKEEKKSDNRPKTLIAKTKFWAFGFVFSIVLYLRGDWSSWNLATQSGYFPLKLI